MPVSRMLLSYETPEHMMANLAPVIAGMILDGRQQASLTMAKLMKPFPLDWERQEEMQQEAGRNLRIKHAAAAACHDVEGRLRLSPIPIFRRKHSPHRRAVTAPSRVRDNSPQRRHGSARVRSSPSSRPPTTLRRRDAAAGNRRNYRRPPWRSRRPWCRACSWS